MMSLGKTIYENDRKEIYESLKAKLVYPNVQFGLSIIMWHSRGSSAGNVEFCSV